MQGNAVTAIFDGLDDIAWAELDHAYGSAADVPDLLRNLRDSDPKIRSKTMYTLYGNVFHQGTRYPATPYVIPFLRRLCADPTVPDRYDIIHFWGSLITGYFNVQERPVWSDGKQLFWYQETRDVNLTDPFELALHQIYQESLKGYELLWDLLTDEQIGIRANAAWVIACLPTKAQESTPRLEAHLQNETSGWVRATIAFTFGELNAIEPLQRMLAEDQFSAARCMAACQLARIQPADTLLKPLMQFLQEPIDGYEDIPGAGGKSTGDAAFAIAQLPIHIQQIAIPALCDQLAHARAFDTIPYVNALLSATFPPAEQEITELTELQKYVLTCMVQTDELWSIANLYWVFKNVGLTRDRSRCAELVGVNVVNIAINPSIARKVEPTWHLADLLHHNKLT